MAGCPIITLFVFNYMSRTIFEVKGKNNTLDLYVMDELGTFIIIDLFVFTYPENDPTRSQVF